MELFAFKLSLSHLERRSVNETIPLVKYTFRQLSFFFSLFLMSFSLYF